MNDYPDIDLEVRITSQSNGILVNGNSKVKRGTGIQSDRQERSSSLTKHVGIYFLFICGRFIF